MKVTNCAFRLLLRAFLEDHSNRYQSIHSSSLPHYFRTNILSIIKLVLQIWAAFIIQTISTPLIIKLSLFTILPIYTISQKLEWEDIRTVGVMYWPHQEVEVVLVEISLLTKLLIIQLKCQIEGISR